MPAAVFDARAAKALKAGEIMAFAPEYPGLRLVASETRRAWIYRYRHPDSGLMKQMKLGLWPAFGFSAAVEAWEKARGARSAGIDVGAQAKAAKKAGREAKAARQQQDTQTVGWLVEQYLTGVERNRKAKGAAETRRMLERAIADVQAQPARGLTRQQASTIVSTVGKTAPRVAAMTRQELRAAWEQGVDNGHVDINPFQGRTLGGSFKAIKRDRVLSPNEAGALLRWWDEPGTHSRTVRDALELVLRTGLRSGEVAGIHVSELAERHGVLWLDIPAERMKGGQAHSVPLVGRARNIVLARKPDDGLLFPSRDPAKPVAQKVLGVEVYACSGRSKAAAYRHRRVCPVKDWAPHDLRRTARTMLAELGCPFEVGEAILSHTLPGVAAVYNRAQHTAAKVDWLNKLNAHLDELRG